MRATQDQGVHTWMVIEVMVSEQLGLGRVRESFLHQVHE